MGWKNLKEHYDIKHQVQVTKEGICIGTLWIHNIIVVGLDGSIRKRYRDDYDANLARFQAEIKADPDKARELINTPDSFSQSIPVYTYKGATIIEKHCESLGYPNVTHDGEIMLENTFSDDKEKVIEWAKEDAKAAIQLTRNDIDRTVTKLNSLNEELTAHEKDLEELQSLSAK